jgi:tRNA(fMet)-specific endonuclease VapC
MTTSAPVLIDTDILSAILRRSPTVVQPTRDYLDVHDRLTFSVITRYEILRGLKAKNADRQQSSFERFCAASSVLYLTNEIIVKASDIYADLYRRGELIGDADILIAATAMIEDYSLATNNERHFSRIADLRVENWL